MAGRQLAKIRVEFAMTSLCKFFAIQPQKRRLLLRTAFLLCVCRLGLWLLPFKTLRRLLANFSSASERTGVKIDTIIWAVAVASRYVPAATCLTQALAGQVLLNHDDARAFLRIGVAKDEQGKFQAHAWVESQGQILIGNCPELFRYTRLTEFEGDPL